MSDDPPVSAPTSDGASHELIDDAQHLAQETATRTPPIGPTVLPSTSFAFPTLHLSTTSLARYPPTPPAALSSKGAAQAMASDMSAFTASLDDGSFVLVDDDVRSDTSFDDGRTVSIASTEHAGSDDGIMTPDDTESMVDVEEELEHVENDGTRRASFETLPGLQQPTPPAEVDSRGEEADSLMDSCFDQDLETPRQSTLHVKNEKHASNDSDTAPQLLTPADHEYYATPTLFVPFLPDTATPDSLARRFRKYGDVARSHIYRKRNVHGFVQMASVNQARAAVKGESPLLLKRDFFLRLDFSDDAMWTAGREPHIRHYIDYSMDVAMRKMWHRCASMCRSVASTANAASIVLLLIAVVSYVLFPSRSISTRTPDAELAVKKEALSTAVISLTGIADAHASINFTHLLPPETTVEMGPASLAWIPRYQTFKPNLVVVSLPREDKRNGDHLQLRQTKVIKGAEQYLDFNITHVVDGLYGVTINSDDAFGLVLVSMDVDYPIPTRATRVIYRLDISCDFGKPSLHHTTTALSKFVKKDIAVARERVMGLGELIALEVVASAAATRNITTELAVYVARDLQVFANTAASVFNQALRANKNATAKVYDVVVRNTQVSLRTLENAISALKRDADFTALHNRPAAEHRQRAKKFFRDGLVYSRTKALNLKSRLTGRKADRPSPYATARAARLCATSPNTLTADCLNYMARCITTQGYQNCKKQRVPEQRRERKDHNVRESYKGPVEVGMAEGKPESRQVTSEARSKNGKVVHAPSGDSDVETTVRQSAKRKLAKAKSDKGKKKGGKKR